MTIEEYCHQIVESFEAMEEHEIVVHHISREYSLVAFTIRALANVDSEGSQEVINAIVDRRENLEK
jgi:hypothetical protein